MIGVQQPLTVRVTGDGIIASNDEGRTVILPSELGEAIRAAYTNARPADNRMSAAALAGLGEARLTRPRPGQSRLPAWRSEAHGEPAMSLAGRPAPASKPLREVLRTRRPRRDWTPPAFSDITGVLVGAGRVVTWIEAPDGYITTRRPTPSAGARHPHDLYLLAAEVDGLAAGTWAFDALRCELVRTDLAHEPALRRIGRALDTPPPPAAIVPVANIERTLSRYPSGISLLWRDAGALLATLQLCATDAGLASCITGTCGLLIDDYAAGVTDTGALALGAPAR
jgi:SagB-type dehydrogenase family enzyme